VITLISFIILLSVLIFVHELGHFLAARMGGVGVLKFSLGFGPKIFGKKLAKRNMSFLGFPWVDLSNF